MNAFSDVEQSRSLKKSLGIRPGGSARTNRSVPMKGHCAGPREPVSRERELALLEGGAAAVDRLGGPLAAITIADLSRQLEARAREFERFGALVNGAALCRALVNDLTQLQATADNRVLSLAEAARLSRYSQAHLARLVKEGKLRSLRAPGSRGRLTFRTADLPRKPAATHDSDAGVHDLASRLGLRGKGGHHG